MAERKGENQKLKMLYLVQLFRVRQMMLTSLPCLRSLQNLLLTV